MGSSYQPFPISAFQTGLYQYLEPWIRPTDAFQPLENAYIYRGSLNKRRGYELIGDQSEVAAGRMFYKDYLQAGVASAGPYTGNIQTVPIIPATITITAGAQTVTDDGLSRLLQSGIVITGATNANPCQVSTSPTHHGYTTGDQVVISGVGGMTQLNSTTPYTITVTSVTAFTLNGVNSTAYGTYTSGGIVQKVAGAIDYTTGAYSITFSGSVGATTGIYAAYAFTASRPIMGLKTWINPANATTKLLAFDTRRASLFNDGTGKFDPINGISQVIYTGDGSTTSITVLTGWVAVSPYTRGLAPFSISITDGTSTIVDDGSGNLSSSGNFAVGGTVNYATGSILLNFTAAPATTINITLTANTAGDYFTGTLQNFFNATNWRPTTVSYLYCTNNVDRVTLFDGTKLSRPPLPITNAHKLSYTNDITTCIDIDVYKNRLLLHRPKLVGSSDPEGQTIRYSAQFNATNFVADVAGNGGALVFPTQDFIMAGEFLRDQMIVFFKNSVWLLQPTGFANPPFKATQINSTKSTNCPYATVPYDQRITSIGSKGLIACDGVNVQRYDTEILDQFLEIEPLAYNQCFAQRFDNINQTWTLYPSLAQSDDDENSVSDKILVYNFLENTWSIYDIAMSCLGLYQVVVDATWATFAVGGDDPHTWGDSDFAWDSYLGQKGSPELLGGSHDGYVYIMNSNSSDDNGAPYSCDIETTLWNPFVKEGVGVDFGYIDLYYETNENVTLDINFYFNGQNDVSQTRTVTLEGSTIFPDPPRSATQLTNFQRIYINVRAQFLQMEIISNISTNGIFKINGMILWAKPSGRLTPGYGIL